MKKRKRGQPRGQDQPLYIQAMVTIYNRLAWNDDDRDFDLARVFDACFDLVAPDQIQPLVFYDDEDRDHAAVRPFITQSDTDTPLEEFRIDALVDANRELGRAFTAHALKRMRQFDDELPEEERESDAELTAEIRERYGEEDKLRIPIIHCEAMTASREPPPQNVALPFGENGPAVYEMSIVPLPTFQQVLDRFGWFLILGLATLQDSTSSLVLQNPTTHLVFKGDKRWIVQGGELDMLVKRVDIIRGVAV